MRVLLFPAQPVWICTLAILALLGSLPIASAADVTLDGVPVTIELIEHQGNSQTAPDGRTVDVVGGTSISSSGAGRAKGNSYRVDIDVSLNMMEFYLDFSDTQNLTFYVFTCPTEFGTYTEVYRDTQTVTGHGADWYSSGCFAVNLTAGLHYILAVSWNGMMTYYYDSGDTQPTSFGAYTHGYATGYDPLPSSFESNMNDQAIYHQRLTTNAPTPVEQDTWGAVKALYR